MRRLVDSVILALVAYTLLWPIIRGLSPVDEVHSATPASAWAIVGRYQAASELQVLLVEHEGHRSFDVTCDPDGKFLVALETEPCLGALLEVRDDNGELLESIMVSSGAGGVVDIGLLE